MPAEAVTVGKTTESLTEAVTALGARIAALEAREAQRSLEHVAAVDALDRLAKRITARMIRAEQAEPEGESPLALRNRLGRR